MDKHKLIRCSDCVLDDKTFCLHTRALVLIASLADDPSLASDPDTNRARLDISRCGMHLRAARARLRRRDFEEWIAQA